MFAPASGLRSLDRRCAASGMAVFFSIRANYGASLTQRCFSADAAPRPQFPLFRATPTNWIPGSTFGGPGM